MIATKIICPHCSTSLKSKQGIPAGQRIRCRKCENIFTVQADPAGTAGKDTPPASLTQEMAPAPKTEEVILPAAFLHEEPASADGEQPATAVPVTPILAMPAPSAAAESMLPPPVADEILPAATPAEWLAEDSLPLPPPIPEVLGSAAVEVVDEPPAPAKPVPPPVPAKKARLAGPPPAPPSVGFAGATPKTPPPVKGIAAGPPPAPPQKKEVLVAAPHTPPAKNGAAWAAAATPSPRPASAPGFRAPDQRAPGRSVAFVAVALVGLFLLVVGAAGAAVLVVMMNSQPTATTEVTKKDSSSRSRRSSTTYSENRSKKTTEETDDKSKGDGGEQKAGATNPGQIPPGAQVAQTNPAANSTQPDSGSKPATTVPETGSTPKTNPPDTGKPTQGTPELPNKTTPPDTGKPNQGPPELESKLRSYQSSPYTTKPDQKPSELPLKTTPPDTGKPPQKPPELPPKIVNPPEVPKIVQAPPEMPTKKIIVKNTDKIRTTLSAENQKKVNNAIDSGAAYLRKTQNRDGSWGNPKNNPHKMGYAALAGMVLLECGAKTDDPAVQKAARFVRFTAGNNSQTYELSLAILFLDKLGDNSDKNLIRKLALRLIAGQSTAGGWHYPCPILNNQETYELGTFLQQTRPVHLQMATPIAKSPNGNLPNIVDQKKKVIPGELSVPITKDPDKNTVPVSTDNGGTKKTEPPGGLQLPFPQDNQEKAVVTRPTEIKKPNVQKPAPKNNEPAQIAMIPPFPINLLSKRVREMAIVKDQPFQPMPFIKRPWPKGKRPGFVNGRDDNSNTQFAMIALWTARKYGVPMDRTFDMIEERFQSSQNTDGGWGYTFQGGSSPQMTCVGLIGLAIGHGTKKEIYGGLKGFVGKADQDPQIQEGLRALGRSVGDPPKDWNTRAGLPSLYFLWSLERTAMLYNLKTVGNKDWYGWAAQLLVSNQRPDGSWMSGSFPGSSETVDTCLALLILRRANLVEDLTESLRLYIPISDPDAAPAPNSGRSDGAQQK